jgi:hypothetical protein
MTYSRIIISYYYHEAPEDDLFTNPYSHPGEFKNKHTAFVANKWFNF